MNLVESIQHIGQKVFVYYTFSRNHLGYSTFIGICLEHHLFGRMWKIQ